ncbi:MAG: hypothetical protein HY606_04115 [Planctomycetes bacterium]|nr:hypothetical protein [Planctomycetota bacterium]
MASKIPGAGKTDVPLIARINKLKPSVYKINISMINPVRKRRKIFKKPASNLVEIITSFLTGAESKKLSLVFSLENDSAPNNPARNATTLIIIEKDLGL